MLTEGITIDDVIELLNDAFSKDPEAMHNLVNARVVCNKELAEHPTIQVGKYGEEYKVGIIGILNGIFGTTKDGYGAIAADFLVICPNDHEIPDELNLKDNCPQCGEQLKLGILCGFKRIR